MEIFAGKPKTASMRDTVGWRFRKFQTPDEDRPHLSVMQFFGCMALESKVSFQQCI